jgi:hypothetical protein
VRDLESNRIERWTGRLPTFARIEIEEGLLRSADLYLFDGADRIARMPDGRLSRLLVKPQVESTPPE